MAGMKDLFGDVPVTFRGSPEQVENIARVHTKIAAAILKFYRVCGVGYEFNVDEVRQTIGLTIPFCAPDSAGRIMRDLRQRGLIDYIVVNRRASLYRITGVQEGDS